MLLDDNELDDAKEALLYLSGFIGYYTNQTSVASRLLHGCYTAVTWLLHEFVCCTSG